VNKGMEKAELIVKVTEVIFNITHSYNLDHFSFTSELTCSVCVCVCVMVCRW